MICRAFTMTDSGAVWQPSLRLERLSPISGRMCSEDTYGRRSADATARLLDGSGSSAWAAEEEGL